MKQPFLQGMYVSKCARKNMKESEKGIVGYILHLPSERLRNQRATVCSSHPQKTPNYSPIKIAPASL